MQSEADECSIKDGRFLVPCKTLAELVDGSAAFSKARGVRLWEYFKRGGKRSRSFIGVKTKAYPDGFLFSFCPCCGTDISAPFAEDENTPAAADADTRSSKAPEQEMR